MADRAFEQGPVQGMVAPGFESLKRLYASETETMAERNTQLCVYYRGERVADLWRASVGDDAFSPDSLVNVFSSGKSLETIAIASLVGKGLLSYDDTIASHWPEFAANGKAETTVADLMRHEAGLAAFNQSLAPEDLLPDQLAKNSVGAVIEEHPARYPGGGASRREYHAITRGWIVNELFRRVDPAGRTIGRFLREDVSEPLSADAKIGIAEEELPRRSPIAVLGIGAALLASLRPKFLGRKIKHGFFTLMGRILRILWSVRNATSRNAPSPFGGPMDIHVFNEPVIAMGETPSAAANCSARGLAKIAAMMAARGRWEGREVLGKSAWEALHADAVEADMGFFPTNFTQGGVNAFNEDAARGGSVAHALNGGREGFYGWMGLGGSIFQWHPEYEIGFAFVPTSLHVVDLMNERGKVYQAEVLRCVEALRN